MAPALRLTLTVDGDLTIEGFRDAVNDFIAVLHGVDEGLSGKRAVRWRLAGLRHGSPASITCVAEPARRVTEHPPADVGDAIVVGIERLEASGKERPRGFTDAALEAAKRLADLKVRKNVRAIAITAEVEGGAAEPQRHIRITQRMSASVDDLIGPKSSAPGVIEGRLQGINSHGRWTFTLYEVVWGGRVICELPELLRAKAFTLFDQRVVVSGVVSRDSGGRPRTVRVEAIDPIEGPADLPQSLAGIDPHFTGELDTREYLKSRWRENG